MEIFNLFILVVGIIIFISLVVFFIVLSIKASVFPRLGFIDNKEELYDITFKKFDFDYSLISGIDNNENQENLISDAIKNINTESNSTIKEVNYYA